MGDDNDLPFPAFQPETPLNKPQIIQPGDRGIAGFAEQIKLVAGTRNLRQFFVSVPA
jgi:hypothetical protein